jgi:hypothetical protein
MNRWALVTVAAASALFAHPSASAWHEKYGVQTQSVSVAAGEAKQLAVTYKGGA